MDDRNRMRSSGLANLMRYALVGGIAILICAVVVYLPRAQKSDAADPQLEAAAHLAQSTAGPTETVMPFYHAGSIKSFAQARLSANSEIVIQAQVAELYSPRYNTSDGVYPQSGDFASQFDFVKAYKYYYPLRLDVTTWYKGESDVDQYIIAPEHAAMQGASLSDGRLNTSDSVIAFLRNEPEGSGRPPVFEFMDDEAAGLSVGSELVHVGMMRAIYRVDGDSAIDLRSGESFELSDILGLVSSP